MRNPTDGVLPARSLVLQMKCSTTVEGENAICWISTTKDLRLVESLGDINCYVIRNEHFFQLELMEYRQGKRVVGADGEETTNDMYHENTMLNKENSHLRTRIKALQETVDVLTAKNSQLLADKEVGNWIRENGSIGSR